MPNVVFAPRNASKINKLFGIGSWWCTKHGKLNEHNEVFGCYACLRERVEKYKQKEREEKIELIAEAIRRANKCA